MQSLLSSHLDVVSSLDEYCDRCSAAAKLKLVLSTGGDLVFCGHHANQHVEDILGHAARISVENGFTWRGTARMN